MKASDKISNMASNLGKSLASIAKVVLLSRKPTKGGAAPKDAELVILANGPSLSNTIKEHPQFLSKHPLLAVNFFANTPEFFILKPEYYVLADPHFFKSYSSDENVAKIYRNIGESDWGITLYIPCGAKLPVSLPTNVCVRRFNLTPVEGYRSLRNTLYRLGLGMPRPRNVLIPSIMIALREGFKKIYLAGADHSWTKTLSVDDDNHVVSIQPHFYTDGDKELKRVSTEYKGYHLHQILNSLTTAFSSYFTIAEFAENIGAKIVNITPGSFIDAFPRNLNPDENKD